MMSKRHFVQFQNLFPFTRVIGGLARLTANGHFDGFTNVINVSYPEEWIRLYWQNGYFEVDPVFQTALKNRHPTLGNHLSRGNSPKQQEFMAAAKNLGWEMALRRDPPIMHAESQLSVPLLLPIAWMQRDMCLSLSILDTMFIWRYYARPLQKPNRWIGVSSS